MAALTASPNSLAASSSEGRSSQFLLETQEALRRGTLYCCLVAASFSAFYFALDYVVFPAGIRALASVRLLYIAFVLMMYVALKHDSRLGRTLGASQGLVIATTTMVSALVLMTGGISSPYYVAYNLVIFVVAALLPWPVWLLVANACAMTLMYVVAVTSPTMTAIDPPRLLNNLYFIAISALAGAVALKIKNELIAAEFSARQEMTENAARQLRFFKVLSHELRAPVTAITGAVGLLQEAPERSAVGSLTESLQLNSDRLLTLLSGFLDFARLESGQLAASSESFDTAALLAEVGAAMRPLAVGKNLALKIESPSALPTLSDPQLLRQSLTNLISNAIKFTHRGGVSVRVRTLEVRAIDQTLSQFSLLLRRPAGEPASQWLCFEIADTGIGIRSEDFDSLTFDFTQLNRPSAGYGGTGLGLAISRRMIQLMGGVLGIRSAVGAGSTFIVLIPWRKSNGDRRRPQALGERVAPAAASHQTQPPTI